MPELRRLLDAGDRLLHERGVLLQAPLDRVPMRIGRGEHHARRAATGVAFAGGAAWLAACASIWGFQDLKAGDAGVDVAESDDANPVAEGGGEAGDATEPGDTGGGDDASLAQDVESDMDARAVRDAARDASNALDAAAGGDAVAFMKCMAICSGCCDPAGTCVTKPSTTACGVKGVACDNCSMTQTCPFASTLCCGATSGICGCAAAGVLCSQN
jgi:hypothetical protein